VRPGIYALLALVVAAGGCDSGPDLLEQSAAPIIGGIEESGYPAVVMTSTSGGSCTGTLIGRRTILTAGHCVIDSIRAGLNSGVARFGSGGGAGFTDSRNFAQLAAHRYYSTFQFYDIALIRLADDAPADVEPMRFNLDPLPDNFVGEMVRVVGFGVSDGVNQTGFGTKRSILIEVDSMGPHHLGFGDAGHNICQGDSGGPTFMNDFPDGEVAIAVSSYGADNCRAESRVARTDTYADWLIEVYDSFEGPCAYDGTCVTEGCRTPDPDCDPCGFDGVCASNCPRPDLDCPLGAFAGELCDDDFDCEGRKCIAALDDPRIKFCSSACDPSADPLLECAAPLAVCSDAGGVGYACYFTGPTPSSQGAQCDSGADCRSGACDGEFGICVERCGDGQPECAEGFSCVNVDGVSACTFPREGGCAVGARGGAGAAAGALLALGLLALFNEVRRRRYRTRSSRRRRGAARS